MPFYSSKPFVNWQKNSVIFITWLIFLIIFIAPLSIILIEGLGKGIVFFWVTCTSSEALAALKLTIIATSCAVFFNGIFGLMAGWCLCKYDFKGKNILLTLIDLPFSISPVIAGLIYTLLYGSQGILHTLLMHYHLQIIYAIPGIILVTIFVTFPFIARSLIALMQTQSNQEEETARLLGASGWQIFKKITFPNIKWAFLYGIVMCTARAMGEFGAVSIVSGHIQGLTNTLPLHIEILYNEYNAAAAFSISILLLIMALFILILRYWCEKQLKPSPKKGNS